MIKKKTAFTLAEVLITLGIIGAVAAMTIPVLMKNYEKRVTLTKLKYSYAVLQQAVKLSIIDNGEISQWNIPNSNNHATTDEFANIYILPYLKGVHKCDWDNLECVPKRQYTLDKKNYTTNYVTNNGWNFYKLINGTVLAVTTIHEGEKAFVSIELYLNNNGKDYIVIGNNSFPMVITQQPINFASYGNLPREGLYFYGEGLSRSELTSSANWYSCMRKGGARDGVHCGALIKLDGWQINYDF